MLEIKLTYSQTAFVRSLSENDDEETWYECLPHERRTAISLSKKGIIEFEDGKEPEKGAYFMARKVLKREASFKFKNPRLVLIAAFRYALGRSTYMPSVIVEEIKLNWDSMSEQDKNQIKDDIEHAIRHNMAGMDCDVREWEKLLNFCGFV